MSTALTTVRAKVAEAISRYSLLQDKKKILVAFSGGADSTLLLTLLAERSDISLAAAHVHHGIRGEEADRDEAFCRSFCAVRDIPFHVCHANIPDEAAKQGIGLEEAARNCRYAFFDKLCQDHGYDLVATAHNADDHLETVLFHLVRGTSLEGLCGIPPSRAQMIRPLLLCEADTIRHACQESGIPYVTDSTNTDTSYTRNYLRAEIVPRLKALNPSLTDAVTRMTELLRADSLCLSDEASLYFLDSGRARLASLPDSVLGRVLMRELRERDMAPEAVHIRQLTSLLRSRRTQFRLSLPGGDIFCDRDTVTTKDLEASSSRYCLPLRIGRNRIDEQSELFVFPQGTVPTKEINKLKNIYKLSIQETIDSATIDRTVILRNRHPGDRYHYGGMTHQVKKLLQSTKLPLADRNRLPFLVRGNEILWIPFFPPADSARGGDHSQDMTVLYLSGRINDTRKDINDGKH